MILNSSIEYLFLKKVQLMGSIALVDECGVSANNELDRKNGNVPKDEFDPWVLLDFVSNIITRLYKIMRS